MPINGLSTGKDITVTLINQYGPIATSRVKTFNAKQKTSNKETMAMDGVNRHLNIPSGWSGDFEMERIGPAMDAFIANLELQYQNGQAIPLITINETITEADGTVSQFQYQGVVITLDSSGDWKGDDYITQKVSFNASTREQLA